MPGLTTRLKLPWAKLEDGADIEQAVQPLAEALDSSMLMTSGADALPAQPQTIGTLYYRTTSGVLYFSTGTEWVPLAFNQPGTIPTSALIPDAGIKQAMLAPEVVNNEVPIGGVIDWWRPQATPVVPVPSGFEICDGHSVAQHDFPNVAGAVVLPNLQNTFILGASANKADTAVADQGNAATQGPGIRGVGGSNAGRDLSHLHGVPGVDHLHNQGSLYTGNHSHGVSVAGNTGDANRSRGPVASGGGEAVAYTAHQHYVPSGGGTDVAGNLGVYGSTGAADRPLNTSTNSTSWTANPGTDFRPYFYGLLRIMKVRRV